ncbi:MAG: Crp/Fnr family transcriptional regulator [Steroidobacteraceae bacterium]
MFESQREQHRPAGAEGPAESSTQSGGARHRPGIDGAAADGTRVVSRRAPRPEKNRLLEALPRQDREQLLAHCERVELRLAEVLCQPEERIRWALFPTGSIVSLITCADAGASLEVGVIGDEGMLGTSLLLGVNVSPQRALVQRAGSAWRIKASAFSRELERSVALRRELGRYTYVVQRELARTAACTHFHGLDARLARWLLTTGDRVHGDQFYITQGFISAMLGVRRAGVNRAAGLLQERELIRYSRGHLCILDRRGLQAAACECYAAAKETYARILG